MELAIVYDNYRYDPAFRVGSGFACIIRTPHNLVLFDSGAHQSPLLYNLEKLGVPPDRIDTIAISHLDSDHYGGLFGFLEKANSPVVYVPVIFPERYKRNIGSYGATVREVSAPREICPGVFTTGELGGGIKEQSLVIKSGKGGVLVVGCGHTGVIKIAEVAQQVVGEQIYMVVGGFHLGEMEDNELQDICSRLRGLGVVQVAPSHCSTDTGISYLHNEFGEGFIESGVGRIIDLESQ